MEGNGVDVHRSGAMLAGCWLGGVGGVGTHGAAKPESLSLSASDGGDTARLFAGVDLGFDFGFVLPFPARWAGLVMNVGRTRGFRGGPPPDGSI